MGMYKYKHMFNINDKTMIDMLLLFALKSDTGVYFLNESYLFNVLNVKSRFSDVSIDKVYERFNYGIKMLLSYERGKRNIDHKKAHVIFKGNIHEQLNNNNDMLNALNLDTHFNSLMNDNNKAGAIKLLTDNDLDIDGYYKCYDIVVCTELQHMIDKRASYFFYSGLTLEQARNMYKDELFNKSFNIHEFKNKRVDKAFGYNIYCKYDPCKPWLLFECYGMFDNAKMISKEYEYCSCNEKGIFNISL